MPGQRFKQVPEMYKGKPVEKLTMKEREQMFKDLGYDAPEFKKGRTVPKGFNEEPDMGSAKKKMAVGGMPKKQAKVATVMKEYKAGKLKSSSGQKVTKPKQAVAIALSEAGMAKKKKAKK
jgi:hypothetical protein